MRTINKSMKAGLLFCFFFPYVATAGNYEKIKLAIQDKQQPIEHVTFMGYIGNRFRQSYENRVLAQSVDKLVEPFCHHNETHLWQSEFWGKWMNSAVLAYQYRPSNAMISRIQEAVDKLIKTQDSRGYIGNYTDETHLQEWDIWGRKYCILGLLDAYGVTHDKKALNAACREADYLINELHHSKSTIVELGNQHGMAASSVLKPICYLYRYTGNKRYFDFAKEIISLWESATGPKLISKAGIDVASRFPKPTAAKWYSWEQGAKAYEMMSCYEGLLEMYRLTGNTEYLSAVEQVWQNIYDTEINITGSGASMESWFGGKHLQYMPIRHFQETCVTATWIKLSRQLLLLTGNTKYADAVEISFYNALLGAMRTDASDWAKYTPLSGQRLPGSEQCGMGLNCCNASGPRGLFVIPQTAVLTSAKGVDVNLYIAGDYKLTTPRHQQMVLKLEGEYPKNNKMSFLLSLKKAENITIRLRIPEWSTATKVIVNDVAVEHVQAGKYLELSRTWHHGDRISIEFDMPGIVHRLGQHPEYVAITRGPIVLARDQRLTGPGLEAFLTPVVDDKQQILLEATNTQNTDIWMSFMAKFQPEAYTEDGAPAILVGLCDYASAGNSSQKDDYPFFKVWMPQLFNPAILQ